MKHHFSTLEICKALDIPRERLRDWMNRDFIIPTVRATGQGTKAEFNRNDAYIVALFEFLLDYGMDRETSASFLRDLRYFCFPTLVQHRKELHWIVIRTKENGDIKTELISSSSPTEETKPMIDLNTGLTVDVYQYYDRIPAEEKREFGMTHSYRREVVFVNGKEEFVPLDMDWNAILIIDFKKIVEKVDQSLSSL